jgi:hypothetical protein
MPDYNDDEPFSFELDLPYCVEYDDYPVIVKEKIKYKDGAVCINCNELYPYVEEPNQKDGSFKCYSCRMYG